MHEKVHVGKVVSVGPPRLGANSAQQLAEQTHGSSVQCVQRAFSLLMTAPLLGTSSQPWENHNGRDTAVSPEQSLRVRPPVWTGRFTLGLQNPV